VEEEKEMMPETMDTKEDRGSREEARKFFNLIKKIDSNNPEEKDLKVAKEILAKNPNLYKRCSRLSKSVLNKGVEKYIEGNSGKMIVEAEMEGIKNELEYKSSSGLERLIIDEVLFARLYLLIVENAVLQEANLEIGAILNNRLNKAQKRFLKAVNTLAKVRKICSSFNIQFNFATDGGQQVNINKKEK